MHTLSKEDIQLLNLLEFRTGAHGKDVVRSDNELVFIVASGDLGKAIGKNGTNLARLRREVGASVEVVEAANSLEGFTYNLFKPVPVQEVSMSEDGGRKTVTVKVEREKKGLAIGRNGERIKRARALLKRYYEVDEVKIM